MDKVKKASRLLHEFKGDIYLCGEDVLPHVGGLVKRVVERATLVRSNFSGSDAYVNTIKRSLSKSNVELVDIIDGPKPNAPREDLVRMVDEIGSKRSEGLISFGGGSNIDASKAANILVSLGGEVGEYFGTNQVTKALGSRNKLLPHIAIQTAASSAAHLTKYSNITLLETGQKKLIVDDAIVPEQPVFDYSTTFGAPKKLTIDGAMDGFSHSLEVLYGAVGEAHYDKAKEIATLGISLIVEHLPGVIDSPDDKKGREGLCLATDLGGYAIMIGGTNGGHLTSFSLVDLLSHGRACMMLNPYYTVLFAPAIEEPLNLVGNIFKEHGYTRASIDGLDGRELGIAVAEAMIQFCDRVGFPNSLKEVDGFEEEYIERALNAAKDPQLKMKLQNMPIPLTSDMVDEYMGSVLWAAAEGDPNRVETLKEDRL